MRSALLSLSFHLLFVFLLLFFYEETAPKKRTQLKVQTVKLTPKQHAPQEQLAAAEAPAPAEVKVKAPQKTKEPLPKKKPLEKAKPKLSDSAKKKIEAALTKSPPKKVGAKIAKLEEAEEREEGYGDLLTKALQSRLSLRSYGAVKVSITLTRDGKVKTFKILSSESDENRKQIEAHLKGALLAPFGRNFPGEKEREFVILLTGE